MNNILQEFIIPVGLTPARIEKFEHFKADNTHIMVKIVSDLYGEY